MAAAAHVYLWPFQDFAFSRLVSTVHAVLSATCSFLVLYFHKDLFDGSLYALGLQISDSKSFAHLSAISSRYDGYNVKLTIAISASYFIYGRIRLPSSWIMAPWSI